MLDLSNPLTPFNMFIEKKPVNISLKMIDMNIEKSATGTFNCLLSKNEFHDDNGIFL